MKNFIRFQTKEELFLRKDMLREETEFLIGKKRFLMRTNCPGVKRENVKLMDNNGNIRTSFVHRLVFESFNHRKIREGYQIDHIDGNKLNNSLENLRECTHKENMSNSNTLRKISSIVTGKAFNGIHVNMYNSYGGIERTFKSLSECVKYF